MDRLKAIKERQEKATPGNWFWKVNTESKSVILWSDVPIRPFIMKFERWGMHSAAPSFRDFDQDIMYRSDEFLASRGDPKHNLDIDHPDAQFIAHSRADIDWLVAEVEKLQVQAAVMREALNALKKSWANQVIIEVCKVCTLSGKCKDPKFCIFDKALSTDAGKELPGMIRMYEQESRLIPQVCKYHIDKTCGYGEIEPHDLCPKTCPKYNPESK